MQRLSRGLTRPVRLAVAIAILVDGASAVGAQDWPAEPPAEVPAHWGPVSINLEEVSYPYPVHYLALNRHLQDMRMAYMDVPPAGTPNGQSVVIFHGLNFYGEAYTATINALRNAGFRVIAMDQIGFGRSSKPIVPYSVNFLASNSKAVLDHLGIRQAAIVGHSFGGMLTTRFTMLYPETVTHMVMVNSIGLTDPRQSRPWRDPGESYRQTLETTTYASVLGGHTRYYPRWHPPHLEYVRRQYGWTLSGDWPHMAMVRTLLSQMLYEDPVVYDWQHIATKALVIGGQEDGLAEDWDEQAHNAAAALQNGTILLYPGVGHNPQIEIPDRFHADLIRFLRSDPAQPAREWR